MINEEIKEQTAKLKNMSTGQKLQYIRDYYSIPIIIAVILLIALISFIHNRLTYKPTVFNLIMIDSNITSLTNESLLDGYPGYNKDFDPDREQIALHADYYTETLDEGIYPIRQKLMMEYGSGNSRCDHSPQRGNGRVRAVSGLCGPYGNPPAGPDGQDQLRRPRDPFCSL